MAGNRRNKNKKKGEASANNPKPNITTGESSELLGYLTAGELDQARYKLNEILLRIHEDFPHLFLQGRHLTVGSKILDFVTEMQAADEEEGIAKSKRTMVRDEIMNFEPRKRDDPDVACVPLAHARKLRCPTELIDRLKQMGAREENPHYEDGPRRKW
ncbi:hypothetical protein OQA88_12733 [Cercophora sp. LCS_1]